MSEPISPALTAEAWDEEVDWSETLSERIGYATQEVGGSPHALAALCLYGQPFGFTREDAAIIRTLVGIADTWVTREDSLALWQKARPLGLSLADRIEALLPPEKP